MQVRSCATKLLVLGVAAGGVESGADRVRRQAGGAAGSGKGKAATRSVEVIAIRLGEREVMAEGGGVGAVEEH
jgi:hypothetical protein